MKCIFNPRGGPLYVLMERIGSGGFGETFACLREDGLRLAAKRPYRNSQAYERLASRYASGGGPRATQDHPWIGEAVQILTFGRGPAEHLNILKAYDLFPFEDDFYFITERLDGDLENLFGTTGYCGPDYVAPVARDVLTGLEWMHVTGAVHRDLHRGNVLFGRGSGGPASYIFKIAELGLADRWAPAGQPERPELIQRDIWAAAGLLVEVAKGGQLDDVPEAVADRLDYPWAPVLRQALQGRFCRGNDQDDVAAGRLLAALQNTAPA